jgi:hypothetical protein
MDNNFDFSKHTLCILNRNDAAALELLLPELSGYVFADMYAIDGMSVDNSIDLFQKNNIVAHVQKSNGRGAAILQGLALCKTKYIIFFSSDGEEDPADLPIMANALTKGSDLVIASRLMGNGSGFKSDHNIHFYHRKLFLKFITFTINKLFNGNIIDCWNGFRGMDVSKAKALNLDAENFLIEAQITIRFLKMKGQIVEIPTKERKRLSGSSQNPVLISGFGHLKLIFNEIFRKK